MFCRVKQVLPVTSSLSNNAVGLQHYEFYEMLFALFMTHLNRLLFVTPYTTNYYSLFIRITSRSTAVYTSLHLFTLSCNFPSSLFYVYYLEM
jgi:hypothetical protein